ncbi:MAG: SDR family NAD(P)-dependent oxidoreductase [Phycisphaerales bacterium]
MHPIDLRGKPIAITGASSGIGRAAALACARAGMPVAAAARRTDRLDSLVAEINSHGGRAVAVPCDVDNPGDSATLVRRTIDEFGSIHAVFANAGYGLEKPIHETTDSEMRSIFETNFFGTLNTVRAALPAMLTAHAGHVLICSSCLAKLGVPGFGAYSATKAAQDHIARAMRIELTGTGVHVSGVYPVGTTTEFREAARREGRGYGWAVHTPGGFMQSPGRVADAIVRCLRRPRPEVWTSTSARLLFALGVACPGLADAVLRRMAGTKNARSADQRISR